MHEYHATPLVLVSGVGRSGTTVLTKSLGRHPAIDSTLSESNVIFDVLHAAKRGCTMPSRKKQMRVSQASYDECFRELILNLLWPSPLQGDEKPQAISTYSSLNPDVAEYLLQLFPNCKIVYAVRNGIEVVSSRMVHHSFGGDPFENHCRVWNQCVDMASWGEHQEAFCLVRHEHMSDVDAIRGSIARALNPLGISDVDSVVQSLTADPIHTTDFPGESSNDLQDRRERWRRWSEEQISTFDRECRDSMAALGYAIPWSV